MNTNIMKRGGIQVLTKEEMKNIGAGSWRLCAVDGYMAN